MVFFKDLAKIFINSFHDFNFQSTYFNRTYPFATAYRTLKIFVQDYFENM